MVESQVKARGITDRDVLDAMMNVKRHEYVPDDMKSRAYQDSPLPIGHGQTISQPFIVAYMTDLLNVDENSKVLEVGTGSGYQAAVLGEIVKEVYTIEIVEPLAKEARQTLKSHKYTNVHVRYGDGYKGWPEEAHFDAIIVTAAPTHIPEPLKEQLAEGGRLIIPYGERGSVQTLELFRKKNGKLRRLNQLPVRFVPLVDSLGNTY